jgi:hypothetical protein
MLNTNQGTIQKAPTELLPSDNRCQTNSCWFDIVCAPWNPSALEVSVIVILEACHLQFGLGCSAPVHLGLAPFRSL